MISNSKFNQYYKNKDVYQNYKKSNLNRNKNKDKKRNQKVWRQND